MSTQTKKIRLPRTSLVLNIDWKLLAAAATALGIALSLTVLLEGLGVNLFAG